MLLDAVVGPLRSADGDFHKKYIYQILPGVTKDSRLDDQSCWCAGEPTTYYSKRPAAGDSLFVCGSLFDLWALAGLLAGQRLTESILFICSTHGLDGLPREWRQPEFWNQWTHVYLGPPTESPRTFRPSARSGDEFCREISNISNRTLLRTWPVGERSWSSLRGSGLSVSRFRKLLRESAKLTMEQPESERVGYETAQREDISSTYRGGLLYEAVQVLHRQPSEHGELEQYKVVVVRSDRTLHRACEMPSPPGTPKHERVHRLVPDGALLQRPPTPSIYATWRWDSINSFLQNRPVERSLRDLLGVISSHLRASVWLPNPNDYSLLACTVVATYCQQIFDAVPLILVTGPKGTGKSELGIAMAQVSANAPPPIGVVTAATMARLIDSTRGFVVLDDLEKVMAKSNGDAEFGELAQHLKLCYKKLSALKLWTDTKNRMSVERLNFFGIKLINNTAGVDEILGSRMLTVHTRVLPDGQLLSRDSGLTPAQCADLRDELHTWAFSNVKAIHDAYVQVFPNQAKRSEEISAPLRVIARLCGDPSLIASLEVALSQQAARSAADSPVDLMEEALQLILGKSIADGATLRTTVSVLEVQMRMRLLAGSNFGKCYDPR